MVHPETRSIKHRLRGRIIGVLGDTHGHLHPAVLDRAWACDLVLHCGDVGDAAVLERLAERADQVLAVCGNNDTPRKWRGDPGVLATLPEEVAVTTPAGTLVVIHGHQSLDAGTRHAWLRRRYPDARLICYGHSHRRVIDRDALPWVLNPGVAGRARAYGGAGMLVLTVTAEDIGIEVFRAT